MTFGGPLIVSSSGSSALPQRTSLDANHVHVWALDEAAGPTWANTGTSTATTLSAAASPGPVVMRGVFSNAAFIRGAGPAGDIRNRLVSSSSATVPYPDVSIDFWCLSNSIANAGYLFYFVTGYSKYLLVKAFGSSNGGFCPGAIFGNGSTSYTIGSSTTEYIYQYSIWHHFMVTLSTISNEMRLYCDGSLVGSVATSGTLHKVLVPSGDIDATGTYMIGSDNSSNTLIGRYCDVRVSNIIRDQTYTDTVYRRGLGLTLRSVDSYLVSIGGI